MAQDTDPTPDPARPLNWGAIWLMLGVALPLAIVFWRWALR